MKKVLEVFKDISLDSNAPGHKDRDLGKQIT